MKAFILAGGFATRLWPLTEKRPKPLLPLAGKAILTHLLDKLPTDLPVTVSTNAAFEGAFREWMQSIGDRPEPLGDARDKLRRRVDLIVEGTSADDHKLGALGALNAWVTENGVDDDVLVLTGDNYLGFSMANFLGAYTGHPLLAAHDIGDTVKASAFGTVILDFQDPKKVQGFEEKPKNPKTTLVSSGCSILPRSTLPILKEYAQNHPDNVGGIFEELLRRHLRVECFSFSEPWMDIGSFHSYLDAHRLLVGDRLLADADSVVDETQTEGSVAVGKGSRVLWSTLKDSMIFDRCQIENCTLRDCVIDSGCVLKGVDLQNQMLRAGTRLEVP